MAIFIYNNSQSLKYERQFQFDNLILKFDNKKISLQEQNMNQKLFKFINYFRTYEFPTNQDSTSVSLSLYLQTELQQSIKNGKTIIDIYQQQIHLLTLENQSLSQQSEQLKLSILEEKKQFQKLLEAERQVIDQLRKELMEKDEESRTLNEKIDHLEFTQADELHFIKTQDNQEIETLEQRIIQEKIKYQNILKFLRENLEDEKNYNSQLIEKINSLSRQVDTLTQENSKLRNYVDQPSLSQNAPHLAKSPNSTPLQPLSSHFQPTTQPLIPHLENILHQQNYPTHTSQDQILNHSYEEHPPTALKDVLNFSGCNSNRFNMTRQFLRSKEKQNIDDNFIKINCSTSPQKFCYRSNENKTHQNQNLSQKPQIQYKHHQLHIREFSTNDNSLMNDPYFLFFTLTAQCIKINSQYFEEIAQIDIIEKEWNYVIEKRIPMNLWAQHLENALLQHVQSL